MLFTVTTSNKTHDGLGTYLAAKIVSAKCSIDAVAMFEQSFGEDMDLTVVEGVDFSNSILTGIFNYELLKRIHENKSGFDVNLSGSICVQF